MSKAALGELIEGYRAFRTEHYAAEAERYRTLADAGQSPRSLVIACSDSRVDPSRIFNARPGELFVVRNVANLVPPYEEGGVHHGTSAAVEFAVQGLKVEHILIMGHARCGGIRAFLEGQRSAEAPRSFIAKWMSLLEPAYEGLRRSGLPPVGEARERLMETAAIANSLANLMTFPFVRRAVERGEVRLDGSFFDIATGELRLLDRETGTFDAV